MSHREPQLRATKALEGAKDRVTNGVTVIDSDHSYIHEGIAFKAHIELASVTADVDYTFKTPADKYVHFKNLRLTALGGTCKLSIRRAKGDNPITFTGTAEAPNDGSSAAADLTGPHNCVDYNYESGVVIKKTPTYDNDEDGEIWDFVTVVGDSTNQFTSVAETRLSTAEELVMKKDTYYIIRFERVITEETPENVHVSMFWYEEGSR